MAWHVEPWWEQESEPCDCCGNVDVHIAGSLDDEHGGAEGIYFVQWTRGRVAASGARFDVIPGAFRTGTTPADRRLVSVAFRYTDGAPGFMLVDAELGRVPDDDLVSVALTAAEVRGTPTAERVFAMLDTIWLEDERLAEVVDPGPTCRAPHAPARSRWERLRDWFRR